MHIGAGGLPIGSAHQMGSARMGTDPATSVARPTGELHDVARRLDRRHVRVPDRRPAPTRCSPAWPSRTAPPSTSAAGATRCRDPGPRPSRPSTPRPRPDRRSGPACSTPARSCTSTAPGCPRPAPAPCRSPTRTPSRSSGTCPRAPPRTSTGPRRGRGAARCPAGRPRPLDDRVKACTAIAEGLQARAQEIALLASHRDGRAVAGRGDGAGRAAGRRLRVDGGRRRRGRVGAPLGQLAAGPPAGRRGRRDHAVELPAAPDRGEGRPGAGRRLHGRAQAVRARAAASRTCWPRSSTRSGLPPGVFNLVHRHRAGRRRGDRVATRPSTWCRSPARPAPAGGSPSWPPPRPSATSLELGGKSASVLLDDLTGDELGDAVAGSLTGCLINSGQTCSAPTRLLVPRDRLAEVEGLLEVFVQFAPVGDPLDPATAAGPARVRRSSRSGCATYITHGARRGRPARRRRAGAAARPRRPGFFVQPTVLVAEAGSDDRAGGGLRAGPHRRALRRRRRAGAGDRERHAVRAVRRGVGGRPRPGGARSRGGCAPGRSASTAGCSTRPRRSAASGRAATAASSGRSGIEEFTSVTSLQL